MQDLFSGAPTCVRGRQLPSAAERGALQDDHERRLAALDRLCAAAAECGVGADPGRDLVVIAEDEVSLLEGAGPDWAALGAAIRGWRTLLPLRTLGFFGFPDEAENPLEEANPRLQRIGGGVEAWAFAALADGGSVYKFYRPSGDRHIGSAFAFRAGDETVRSAEARLGDYRELLEKLWLIQVLGGLATEVVGVTPEGIVVAKQTLGDPLPQGDDVSRLLPPALIEIPSRFLRADRDHPRLFFLGGRPWLVADLHARNFVRGTDGALHLIDLVAAPWPEGRGEPLITDWLARVRADPRAGLLGAVADEEL